MHKPFNTDVYLLEIYLKVTLTKDMHCSITFNE